MTAPLTIGDVMTRGPWVVDDDAPLRQARSLMVDREVHHLPVTHQGTLVGVLSDRDVKRALDPELGLPPEDELSVRGVWVFAATAAGPPAPPDGGPPPMADRHIGSALVTEDDRDVGILTPRDASRLFAEFLHAARPALA